MHLYNITELCDCVDMRQKPIVEDIGFLVGKNPFAVDKIAGELLSQRLSPSTADALAGKLTSARATADYVHRHYGIRTDGPVVQRHLQGVAALVSAGAQNEGGCHSGRCHRV